MKNTLYGLVAAAMVALCWWALAGSRPDAEVPARATDAAVQGSFATSDGDSGGGGVALGEASLATISPVGDAGETSIERRATTASLGPTPAADGMLEIRVVEAGRGVAIGSARVDVYLTGPGGDPSEMLVSGGTAAEDGTLLIDVDLPAETALAARAVAEGFTPGTARLLWRPNPGSPRPLEVSLARGATLVGRLFDGAGEPLGNGRAHLEPLATGGDDHDFNLPCLRDGSFAVAPPALGEFELLVSKTGLGTSPLVPIRIEAGELIDLGDLAILGSGVLEGRAQFPDGSPVPGLSIRAMPSTGQAPGGQGFTRGQVGTQASGAFSIAGLAPGLYDLEASPHTHVAVQRMERVVAPSRNLVVTCEGWLVEITALDDGGQVVAMDELEIGAIDHAAAGFGAISKRLGSATSHTALLPRTALLLRAKDTRGRVFVHRLAADLPSGHHTVELRTDDPTLASVRVRVTGEGLVGEERLSVMLLPRGEGSIATEAGSPGASELIVQGLTPGTYYVRSSVLDARFSVADAEPGQIEVRAGEQATIDVPTSHGGRLEFVVRLADAGDDSSQAASLPVEIHLRGAGEPDWTRSAAEWANAWGGVTTSMSGRLVAPFGLGLMLVGDYEVKLEVEGYRSEIVAGRVLAGQVTPVAVDLVRAP
ncbi:carboxypeptidase-like regulatory domain-containing protein [Engelhardtia mirabilis]|uniref:Carboxypeptidase regulatory-like domain-containing protein n=1 Tax=Engelhardtia mirabilis TaxID=2528011 RepID=A0A518BI49_9BACT|nr:hypothetical protein Pla133_16890 [Planctomycetes bacterium Pla133]QDV00939.1 hypothetical protein Pla86_16880 [Planctomycetes bacterium Pla86]